MYNPQPVDWTGFISDYLDTQFYLEKIVPEQDGKVEGVISFCSPQPLEQAIFDAETGKQKVIRLNYGEILLEKTLETESPQRLKFTALHEAGHWFIHPEYYALQGPAKGQLCFLPPVKPCFKACRDIGIGRGRLVTTDDFIEHQASVFASAICIPKKPLLKIFPDYFAKYLKAIRPLGNVEFGQLADNEKDFIKRAVTNDLAELFAVSFSVAKFRLEKLGLWTEKEGTLLDIIK